VLIRDLAFSSDARVRFDERLVRLPWILSAVGPTADRIREFLFSPLESVVDYLEASLRIVTDVLGIYARISRSSGLNLNPLLRGQARVIAAAKSVGATHYINPPGGRALYDADTFVKAGIELSFLPSYEGRFFHLLPALMMDNSEEMRFDVDKTELDPIRGTTRPWI
jgi:hypothetical protein